MSGTEDGKVIQMACLGRPFTLGMLYDCRKDMIIPGETLWDDAILTSAVASKPQVGSGYEIIAEDSLESKATNLDIGASLKLSFMGGLVEVKGAAKYLDDHTSSLHQSRVSLKYWSTTRFDQLTMEQLGKIQYPGVLSKKVATHVVTGIHYGADAFFVFDRKIKAGEDKRTVNGNMEVLVKALPGITEIKGDAKVNLSQNDREEADKFECTFHGDLRLPNNPTTFDGAVKIYHQLPELVQGDVPKEVWLYPLTKLSSDAAKVVHEISVSLVNKAQKFMEEMLHLEMKANDLLNTNVCSCFSGLQQQLSKFKGRIAEFKITFSKKLSYLLPRIREGGEEESQLAEVFISKEASGSPFSNQQLTLWIKTKQQEIKVLETYLQAIQKVSTIRMAFKTGDLDAIVTDMNYDYVVCFSFNVIASDDQLLEQMSNFLQNATKTTSALEKQPWFKNKELIVSVRHLIRQFISFAEANEETEKTVFAVTDGSEVEHEGAEILLYENGLSDPFSPPSNPKELTSNDGITHCSVKLKWSEPEYGSESVKHYTVSYGHKSDAQKNWKTKATKGNETFLTIENLQAQTVYQFKVRAECDAGVSKYSDITQIPTLSPPVDRLAIVLKSIATPIDPIIESPSLSIFELPKQEIFHHSTRMIRKVDIGENPLKQVQHKVLMVVGATGAGKSTLINGMVNYMLGVTWSDNFRFKLIVDQVQTQAKSVTSEITAYTIYQMEGSRVPYTLTIIDTPGFGDTSGLERDKKITAQIKEFFSLTDSNGIDHLDGIGFVTQSALVRLTPTQQYIFDSILSVFGKDVAKNIFIMVTFCDGQKPPVITAIKEAKIPCSEHFKFNNSALYADNTCSELDGSNEDNFDEMFWKMGVSSFKKFFTTFQKAESVSLIMTRDVLTHREKLETTVIGLQGQMNQCLAKMEVIRQHKQVLKEFEAEIIANKNFTFEIKTPYFEYFKLDPGEYVTNCLYCTNTCHYPCYIPDNGDKWCCAAMSGNASNATCNVCKNRCSWEIHKNTGERIELCYKTEVQNHEDLKEKYDDASSGKSRYETMIENSEGQLEEAHADLHSLVEEARECLKILTEIALKPNPLTQLEYIQLLIDAEKKQAHKGWHDRVKYLEKSKDQAALLAVINDDKDIDQRIQEEKLKKKAGWKERVEKLEQVKRIKHAVDQNKAKKKENRVIGFFKATWDAGVAYLKGSDKDSD